MIELFRFPHRYQFLGYYLRSGLIGPRMINRRPNPRSLRKGCLFKKFCRTLLRSRNVSRNIRGGPTTQALFGRARPNLL